MTKSKNGVGQPTKMTEETLSKLEQAFSLGCSDVEACLFAGIHKSTLYNYQERNPEYVDRKEALKDKLVLKARTVVADALQNKDKETAKWYLERKKKAEFSTKVIEEISGTTTQIVVRNTKDAEALKELKDEKPNIK